MKNEIVLNYRELKRISSIAEELYGPNPTDWSKIEINSDSCEIGSTVTATYIINHKEIVGEFTVTITNEENW
jgi:hypothetical protein